MTPARPLTRVSALRWWLDHTPHLRRATRLWWWLSLALACVVVDWLETILVPVLFP